MIPLSDDIPSRRPPIVTVGIIVTCVLVFLYEYLNPAFVNQWAFKPAYLMSRQLLEIGPALAFETMLVSVFLHGGLFHVGGNMLFLWVFGDNVEDRMGHSKFLIFYLACGVLATLAHSFSAVFGLLHSPDALDQGVVGASGAIAGVLGAYYVFCPHSRVRTLIIFFIITIVNIPASLFIVFWFIMQLFSGVGSLAGTATGVAYWAHIGGFVVGYLVAKAMTRPRRPPAPRVINLDIDDL